MRKKQCCNSNFALFWESFDFLNSLIVNGNVNWNDYDLIFPVAELYAGELG